MLIFYNFKIDIAKIRLNCGYFILKNLYNLMLNYSLMFLGYYIPITNKFLYILYYLLFVSKKLIVSRDRESQFYFLFIVYVEKFNIYIL